MKLEMDSTDDVKKVFDRVVEKYPEEFEFLVENAQFIFTFREKPTYDDEGRAIAATASKCSNRERDLYGSDFEICVHRDTWEEYNSEQKEALIFHEMLHCGVFANEEDETVPMYDNDDRVSLYMNGHDVVVKTFKREIEEYGLHGSDVDVAKFMSEHYAKHLEKRNTKPTIKQKKAKR